MSLSSFADQDMLMQYHWGLAVGHVYSHRGLQPAGQHEPDSNMAMRADVSNSVGTSYSVSEEHGLEILRQPIWSMLWTQLMRIQNLTWKTLRTTSVALTIDLIPEIMKIRMTMI